MYYFMEGYMNKIVSTAAVVIGVLGLTACASQPDKISAAYVSPIQYQSYSCDQIRMELARTTRRANDLHGSLKETADNDQAQMAVGLILLWPTLFFLEGGDGPQAQEYARMKGERDALEEIAIQKNCGIIVQPVEPEKTPEEAPKEG